MKRIRRNHWRNHARTLDIRVFAVETRRKRAKRALRVKHYDIQLGAEILEANA